MKAFKTELDGLAIALAKAAKSRLTGDKKSVKDDMNLQESTDAFKALATYYGILTKPRRARDTEDEQPGEGFTFDNHGLADGDGTQVRGGRRN